MTFFTTLKEIQNWLNEMNIHEYEIVPNQSPSVNEALWSVNVNQDIHLHNKSLIHLPIQFGYVKGVVDLTKNQLISLKGSPFVVEGNFACYNNQLTHLTYAPQKIKGYFRFSHNPIMPFNHLDIDCNGLIYMSKVKGIEYLDKYEVIGKYTTMLEIPFKELQELLLTHHFKDKLDKELFIPSVSHKITKI